MDSKEQSLSWAAFIRYLVDKKIGVIVTSVAVFALGLALLVLQFPNVLDPTANTNKKTYTRTFAIDPSLYPTIKLLSIDYIGIAKLHAYDKEEVNTIVHLVHQANQANISEDEMIAQVHRLQNGQIQVKEDDRAGVMSFTLISEDPKFGVGFIELFTTRFMRFLRDITVTALQVYVDEAKAGQSKLSDESRLVEARIPFILDDLKDHPDRGTTTDLYGTVIEPFTESVPKLGIANVNAIIVLFLASIFISITLFSVIRYLKIINSTT